MDAEWEYTVVQLPESNVKTRERDATELLNKVAQFGWRLIAVTADPGQYGARTYAYFERPAVSDD